LRNIQSVWRRTLAEKLGLNALDQAGDDELTSDLFDLLQEVETDFTLFFRLLATVSVDVAAERGNDTALVEPLRRAFYTDLAFAPPQLSRMASWLRRYAAR